MSCLVIQSSGEQTAGSLQSFGVKTHLVGGFNSLEMYEWLRLRYG